MELALDHFHDRWRGQTTKRSFELRLRLQFHGLWLSNDHAARSFEILDSAKNRRCRACSHLQFDRDTSRN